METIVIKTVLNLISKIEIATQANVKFRRGSFPILKITSSTDLHKDVEYICFYNKTKKNLFSETFELSHIIIKYKGISIFDKAVSGAEIYDPNSFKGHKFLQDKDTTFKNYVNLHNFLDYEHKPVN